uniref:[histone H4]-lysine(20) N-methyltransferase n=1 Tax=Amphilophus citrinellus TaxID=61819 RepID=A0A3Q0RNP8_AMPCI
ISQETVCSSHSVTIFSCTKSISSAQDEKTTIRLTQEGKCSPVFSFQNDAQKQEEREYVCSRSTVLGGENSQNRKVTDFYPVRRSSRKSKTELKCEQKKLIDDLITNGIEEGMEVQHIEGKGRAVFATRCFQKGDYVVEYHGDLLQITDAKKREAEYAQNPATGCYMYYFQYLCKTYCVDATKETGRMGRLINHSKNGNCQTKLHDINGVPHLILIASRNIDKGEELLYDYGDRSKASIAAHPWLKY